MPPTSRMAVAHLPEVASSINAIASFLAHEQIKSAEALELFLNTPPPDPGSGDSVNPRVVVFCASAVLSTAEDVFSWASTRTSLQSVSPQQPDEHAIRGRSQGHAPRENFKVILVLCGGIGHSTTLLYDAVKNHPVFNVISDEIHGKPEALVMQAIAKQFYRLNVYSGQSRDVGTVTNNSQGDLQILVEDQSTNCGANASETRKVLEAHGVERPQSIVIIQDPTMSRRTVASFQHVYQDIPQEQILSWPTFVPGVCVEMGQEEPSSLASLAYKTRGQVSAIQDGLWSMDRFVDLIMGEIPRLRDDAAGYGPRGKGFIGHVEIPPGVEAAWTLVDDFLHAGGKEAQRKI
ncbi:hypothetical protein AK830_g10750 [Neonectria ditissima]|uniref:Uncharacterized protein n=1 Tax=Neonectria ditissima TaxID=78410 RepID=A0A0P7AP68_9HYPO|nr:hypothetical protein AK830_g10750 [Neonectria ditissima]